MGAAIYYEAVDIINTWSMPSALRVVRSEVYDGWQEVAESVEERLADNMHRSKIQGLKW